MKYFKSPNLVAVRQLMEYLMTSSNETFSALLAICAGNSPHKGQWRGALMFSLICASVNAWVNNLEAGDLRRYRTHYDVTLMMIRGDLRLSGVSTCVINQNLHSRSTPHISHSQWKPNNTTQHNTHVYRSQRQHRAMKVWFFDTDIL